MFIFIFFSSSSSKLCLHGETSGEASLLRWWLGSTELARETVALGVPIASAGVRIGDDPGGSDEL